MTLLKDQHFYELCKLLKLSGQTPSDPDRKVIEKAFRKLALKTHPDKGGDPLEFRLINDAYNKLIAHVSRLEAIEAETDLSNTSVIIEISKQSLPKWWEKLRGAYGSPKTSNVKNTMFQGPFKQYKSRGKLTGPIVLVLYEDPEDKVPKIHCRCDNYMAWIQEQKMPLHLHVGRDKKIMFDQWRIMSLAEFGFVSLVPGTSSARHDWKDSATRKSKAEMQKEQEDRERAARAAREAAERQAAEEKRRMEEAEAERLAEEERLKEEAEKDKENRPWWQKYADRYQGTGGSGFQMGETTPPPEDDFPKVFSMTSNSYTQGGLHDGAQEDEEEGPTKEEMEQRAPKVAKITPTAEAVLEQNGCQSSSPEMDAKVVPECLDEADQIRTEQNTYPTPDETAGEQVKPVSPSQPPTETSSSHLLEDKKKVEPSKDQLDRDLPSEPVKPVKESGSKQEEEVGDNKENNRKEGKRNLGNLTEKLLAKSKVKKLKSKKAVIKKAAKAATTVEETKAKEPEPEPPSVEIQKEEVSPTKEPDVKEEPGKAATRKRPLEDANDVEGSKRNWENILHQMEQRNSEIMESLTEMKCAMADTCKKINKLSL